MRIGIIATSGDVDALTPPTEATKKDYVIVDDTNVPKVVYKGYVNGSYVHNLGYIPLAFAFIVDNMNSPSEFEATRSFRTNTTTFISDYSGDIYVILLGGLG